MLLTMWCSHSGYTMITIKVMNGIGDSLWWLGFMPDIAKDNQVDVLLAQQGNKKDGRSLHFLKRFPFLHKITQAKFPLWRNPSVLDGRIAYHPGVFCPNKEIEWDTRLEDYVPFQYDWNVMDYFRSTQCEVNKAQALGDYITIHMGSRENNTIQGMNTEGKWTKQDWCELLYLLHHCVKLPIIALGAYYDQEYFDDVMLECRVPVRSLIGKTTPCQLVPILRKSKLMVSYTDGLPILSAYLKTPTVCWWPQRTHSLQFGRECYFSESFATNWTDEWTHYKPVYYQREGVKDIFELCLALIDNTTTHHSAKRSDAETWETHNFERYSKKAR